MLRKAGLMLVALILLLGVAGVPLPGLLGPLTAYAAVLPQHEGIANWSFKGNGGADADYGLDSVTTHLGTHALWLTDASPKASNVYLTVWQSVPVKPGTTYTLSVWVKGDNVHNAWFGGGPSWSFRKGVPDGTYDWQKVTATYTTGASETAFDFRIMLENVTNRVWFDDMTMSEAGTTANLLQNGDFENVPQTELINGFETPGAWIGSDNSAGKAVTEQVYDNKKEGQFATKMTYTVNPNVTGWINESWSPNPKLDLSDASKLMVDIYPSSQTSGSSEPLYWKITDDTGVLYESPIGKLAVGKWNTVAIDLSTLTKPRSHINQFSFYVYTGSSGLEGRSQVAYTFDNLRAVWTLVQPVAASPAPGQVTPGTPVALSTATVGAAVYYTLDGTNPTTSVSRTAYTGPIVINGASLIKAYASRPGLADSAVTSFGYSVGSGSDNETLLDWNAFLNGTSGGNVLPVFAASGIQMDGNLDEWAYTGISLPANSTQVLSGGWGGADDLSAKAQFAYDADNFYLGVKVKDNVHQAFSGADMWTGDSVQVAFSPNGATYGPEYGFANVDGNPEVWRWNSGTATLGKEAVTLKTSGNGNETVYEVKMPWKAIFSDGLNARSSIPFTLLINDNDGDGRKGWIEWTSGIARGKDPTQFAKLQFVPQGDQWAVWMDGKAEVPAGVPSVYSVYVPNFSNQPRHLNLSIPFLNLGEQVDLPAGTMLKKDVNVTFPQAGSATLQTVVTESATGKSRETSLAVKVSPNPAELRAKFDSLAARLPALQSLLSEVQAKGLPTDYETVDVTVIRNFIEYGRDDIDHGYLDRAAYVASELENLYADAESRLHDYLQGSKKPWDVPRYVTGSSRPQIHKYSFVADTKTGAAGTTEKGAVFFTGYGHFGQVRKDIPQFSDYGTNIIQVETGPNKVILPPASLPGWSVNKAGGVKADAVTDRTVVHSGQASLKITNTSPLTPQVYLNVTQNVSVKPSTTYQFRVWVKGDNVKNVWFPGGNGWTNRVKFPTGTYDWTEVSAQYTTGAGETSLPFVILSENAVGAVWIDDVSMTEVGSATNLLLNPGFDDDPQTTPGKDYLITTDAIQNDIVKVLQNAAEHNIAVNLLISPQYFPKWAYEMWPETRSNNQASIRFNFDAPKSREIIEDYLRALIPLVKNYPSLHSITLSNEPVYKSNVDNANLPAWHSYLQAEYGTVADLNRIYGSSYGGFDEVPMPGNIQATPAFYDWVKFNNELFSEWHQWMADIIHEIAPDIPVQAKIMNGAFTTGALTWGIDPEQFAALSQISGDDSHNYYGSGKASFLSELKFYDLQASLKQAPVFNSEDHIIPDGDNRYIPQQAPHVQSVLWQGAVHGRSGSTIWVWERTYDKNSDFAGGVMHRPDVAAVVGKTNLDLNRLADKVTALQEEKARVAILYSLPSMVYDSGYPDMLGKAYEAISLSGLKTGFVTEKQVQEGKLDDYRMVIVPKAGHIQADTLSRLKLYADNGGKIVVLGGDSLRFDEHNQPLPADIRSKLLGQSTVLESISSADQLRGMILPMFTALHLNSVMLYDAATGEPVKDVEWRSVKVNNKWLINIDNYSAQPKTVYVKIDNKAVTAAAELIEGTTVNTAGLTLQPLKPVLLSLAVEEVTDETPPTTTAALEGVQRNGWYVSGVTVSLRATDEKSGVAKTVYSLDGGTTWQLYAVPLIFQEDGVHTLSFRSVDTSGNVEQPQTVTFSIDQTAPVLKISGGGTYTVDQNVLVTCTATDTISGVVYSTCSTPLLNIPAYRLNIGDNTITAGATDAAGNAGTATTTVTVEVTLDALIRLVKAWIIGNGDQGIVNSLVAKLQHGQFDAFIHEVNAQEGKKISAEAAGFLIKFVNALK